MRDMTKTLQLKAKNNKTILPLSYLYVFMAQENYDFYIGILKRLAVMEYLNINDTASNIELSDIERIMQDLKSSLNELFYVRNHGEFSRISSKNSENS